MSFIRFSHPQYLLLLPVVWAYTWWVLRGSLAELGRSRGRLAAGFRGTLLMLLVLALAGIQLVRPTTTLCTVFVIDVSDSVAPTLRARALEYIRQAAKEMKSTDRAAVVVFGGEALLDRDTGGKNALKDIKSIYSVPGASRTDIAAGIQLAMASFPQESGKQVVLFSDGNENLGNALDQSALAKSNDVRISVVPLTRDTSRGEALILRVETPMEVRQGAPFQVNVLVESLKETDGAITLYRNNTAVETRQVHLRAGKTAVAFEESAPASGLYHYKAILSVPETNDTLPDNNSAYSYARARGRPVALIIEGNPGEGERLAQALRRHDIQVEGGGPERIPASLAECAMFDSLVFANVPAWRMSATQMIVIRSAVRDTGMGFAMLGGNESFGVGSYYQTPIEDALPVSMDAKKKKQLPSVSLVIVIDVSGSMGAPENGVSKIKLAAEAAKAAVALLQPIDNVCVIGYDTPDAFVYVVKKQTPASNKATINRQIDTLSAGGGGIVGLPALEEARKALQGADTQVKHIIFCADTADIDKGPGDDKKMIDLARRMTGEKITISSVGFGQKGDPDWPLLQDIAKAGGGHSYLAERLSHLPQIFSGDIMEVSRSLLVEKPFHVRDEGVGHSTTRNIGWASAPPLLGYVCTSMKETPIAQQLLSSPEEDPILATWTYGLGRSLAFTSDATTHWGAHWVGWQGYEPFWSQALRWTLRQGAKSNFQTMLTEEGGKAKITVDAVTLEGEYRNLLELRAHVSHVDPLAMGGPRAMEETIALEQNAPGHYEGKFDARATGSYVVTVEERDGDKTKSMQTSTLVIPYSPEYQAVQPNAPLLTRLSELTGGAWGPAAADVFGKLRFGSRSLHDLWPLLALIAALLFLIDVAVRRVLLPWDEFFAACREVVAARLPKWRRARQPGEQRHAPVLDTLLRRKEEVKPREAPTLAGSLRNLREQAVAKRPQVLDSPELESDEPSAAPPPEPAAAAPPASRASAGTVGNLLQKKRDRQK